MTGSKGWEWRSADKGRWLTPSEYCMYYAKKWSDEGARTVLDLGCGLGRHALYFAAAGFQVTAVDISEEAVRFTGEAAEKAGAEIRCVQADMLSLPFEDGSFDRIFSYQVISHQDTAGVERVVREMTRVLRRGGELFVTMCSKEHWAYSYPEYPHIDENTVLKTDGAEVDVPHFFADREILKELFRDYDVLSLRRLTDCTPTGEKEASHFLIEAEVRDRGNAGEMNGIR